MSIEAKFQNSRTIKFQGFIWHNANKLPYLASDKGKHVFERFLILSCDNVIPPEKRDGKLQEKLLAERDITVSVAVQYLMQAINRGYKFTESERTIKNREEYEIRNNSLKLFLTEHCEIVQGKRTRVSVFKWKYKNWCTENGLTPEKPNDITKILANEYNINKIKSSEEYYDQLEIKDI